MSRVRCYGLSVLRCVRFTCLQALIFSPACPTEREDDEEGKEEEVRERYSPSSGIGPTKEVEDTPEEESGLKDQLVVFILGGTCFIGSIIVASVIGVACCIVR